MDLDDSGIPDGTEQTMTRAEHKSLSNELLPYETREATWAAVMKRVGAEGQNYRWPDWTSPTFYTAPL